VELTSDKFFTLGGVLDHLDSTDDDVRVESAVVKLDGTSYLVRRNKDDELYFELGD
jgi:hypothetical protein